jgi:hypothetical protein
VDPAGQFASPYEGMGNDPVGGSDPTGGEESGCCGDPISLLCLFSWLLEMPL